MRLLTGKIDYSVEELSKRFDSSILFMNRKESIIMIDIDVNIFENKLLRNSAVSPSITDERILKGQTAYKGRVIGQAILLDDIINDLFIPGRILVVTSTRPELVPFMKQSLAVVTDQGGLLSHAAITSRELELPCIVGTKIATKIIKSGDFLEVNADKGLVKILSKEEYDLLKQN